MLLQSNTTTACICSNHLCPTCSLQCIHTKQRWKDPAALVVFFPSPKEAVKVGARPRGNLAADCCQAGSPKWCFPIEELFFSALLLIVQRFIVKDKPYHAPFTVRLNMPWGLRYLFRLDVWHNGKILEAAVTVSHAAFSRSRFQWRWLS